MYFTIANNLLAHNIMATGLRISPQAIVVVSQTHFGLSVRMKFTLPKVGSWSPSGLPKLRARLQGSKHLALGYSLCNWKGLEVYMSKIALHEP
jgi:hypothetical protein